MKLLFFLLACMSIKCSDFAETMQLSDVGGDTQNVVRNREFYSPEEKIVLECGHVCNKTNLENQNCMTCNRQSQTVRIIFENGSEKFGLSKPIGISQILELNKHENKPVTKLLSRYKTRCHPSRSARWCCCFGDIAGFDPLCCGEVSGCLASLVSLGLLFLR